MQQPFRHQDQPSTIEYPFAAVDYCDERIVMRTHSLFSTLSNAVWNGGFAFANHFVNWKVPLDFDCQHPSQAMQHYLNDRQYPLKTSVGLQTAACLQRASLMFIETQHFACLCCVTVGTGNAVRAGQSRPTFSAYIPGTVNCMVLIDAKMTNSAMVNMLITITEAKTAALQDIGIHDSTNGLLATGTTTDAVIVGVSQSHKYDNTYQYAGTATDIGHCVERIIYKCVQQSGISQWNS